MDRIRIFLSLIMLMMLVVPVTQARMGLPDFTALAQEQGPAVVNISTSQKISMKRMFPHGFEIPDLPEDNPFSDLLRKFLGKIPHGGYHGEHETQSLGSGFILSRDGYIVTNNHVISEADEIIVRLSDRREFKAELIGTDKRSDVAVLKIEANDLPIVKIGRSEDLQVGEWVLAIGSPFGFEHSVTAGIVSAKGRSLPSENYIPFIQTDVAINPGNSGGPLFNLDGEVVGVNSQIYSRTGGFMGLSFAIPIDVAVNVVEQLRTTGHVSRGWLGVLIQDVTRELAESFGIGAQRGALVAQVMQDSPAQKAGMQVGDIVMRFNGVDIYNSSDLPPVVGGSKVGKRVPVTVLRNGNEKKLFVVLEQLPDDEQLGLLEEKSPGETTDRKLGLTVEELDEEQRETLAIDAPGVLISKISDGPARRSGLREGDVILMLNNEKVENIHKYNEIAESLPTGRSVPVLVHRRGNPVFLALRLDE